MKNTISTLLILFISLSSYFQTLGQDKAIEKEVKEILKKYKKENWKITGTERSDEIVIYKNIEKLNTEEYITVIGQVSQCRSINICATDAQMNAITLYSTRASANVSGELKKIMEKKGSGKNQKEIDDLAAEFSAKVQTEIGGLLEFSYAIIREKSSGDGNEYQAFYLINKEAARNARLEALKNIKIDPAISNVVSKEELVQIVEQEAAVRN